MSKKLKEWLVSKGMSVSDLARELGVSRSWASFIANGGRGSAKMMMDIDFLTKGEVSILDYFKEHHGKAGRFSNDKEASCE